MTKKTDITRSDIWPMERYEKERKSLRKQLMEAKRHRRLAVGPVCTFYFENYETMWAQVHEMLYIERGGEEQIEDELSAFNPLVPKGRNLSATVMFEIDDRVRRNAFLAKLGGIEETAFFELGEQRILGVPEEDLDRTTADGKASSVQFIHFHFDPAQIELFRQVGGRVILGFTHPQYAHMAVLPEATRAALAGDFA
ncbi:MAG TPA: DUF3501 family protein [Kiloniellales bacterium]|nr:DUF3501 family protein [Kiloniellales bacterium]